MRDYIPADPDESASGPDPATDPFDLLAEVRAARPGGKYEQDQQDWMRPVADKLADHETRSLQELAFTIAMGRVRQTEANDVRELNRVFAEQLADDALAIWTDRALLHKALRPYWDLPLVLSKKTRVRLGHAETDDLAQYVQVRAEELAEAVARGEAEIQTARNILEALRRFNVDRVDRV